MMIYKNYITKENIHKVLFLSMTFFVPISQRVSTLLIGMLFIFSLYEIKSFRFQYALLPLVFIYLFYCISLFYSSEFQISIIEKKASFLIFPLIFMLYKNINTIWNDILKYFVLGSIVALFICEILAFYHSIEFSSFRFDSRTDPNISLTHSIVGDKNFFLSYNFSVLHQTVYFSMYLLFALIIIFYRRLFSPIFRYLCMGFLILGLFQILNKAAFLIFITLVIVAIYSASKNKKQAVIGILLFGFIGLGIFISNPRFKKFNTQFRIDQSELKINEFSKIHNKNPQRANTRVMLWVSAIELINDNPLFGIGAGGSHNRLYERFAVKRQWYDKSEKYHAHNQYLQVILDVGLIGFIPFSLLFIFLGTKVFEIEDRKSKMIILSFILIIAINFLFESMFERYSGISFFTFFYCLLLNLSNKNFNELKT